MATLREAIPDYKTNGIFKNIPGISSWGMSPELLDITLMGKYGNKTINSLMKEFTNNQGVVQDMSGLTNLVWQFHQDNWMKLYDAMRQDYNPIKPYSKDIESSQTVDNDVIKQSQSTTTNNLQKKNTGTVGESGTISDDIDTTKTSTLSGSDVESKAGTDTTATLYNSTLKDEDHLQGNTRKTVTGAVELQKQGAEDRHVMTSLDGSNNPVFEGTKVFTDNNRIAPTGQNWEAEGVKHNVTNDKTLTSEANTAESIQASNPYDETGSLGETSITSATYDPDGNPGTDPVHVPHADDNTISSDHQGNNNFKPTDAQHTVNNNISQNDHTLNESTINKDFSHSETAEVKNYHEYTNYGQGDDGANARKDTTTYNNYSEQVTQQSFVTDQQGNKDWDHVDHVKSGTDTDTNTYNSSLTTQYGKVDTLTESGDNTRTIANTRTDNLTEALTGTVGVSAGDTVTNDTSIESQSSAVGNLGFMTSQRQLEEEINLRQKYFYDGVVKDVAKLLTVGTYA